MSDPIKDILKAKQAAIAAAKEAGAIPGTPTEVQKIVAATETIPNIATGMQSSVESAGMVAAPQELRVAVLDENLQDKAMGTYLSLGLQKFFKKKGKVCKSVNGYFYAMDEEELKELEHFVGAGKVVRA